MMKMRGGHCQRSEAIFVLSPRLERDYFVALLLVMTSQIHCGRLLIFLPLS